MSSNLVCVRIFISFSCWTFCFSCHIIAQGKRCWVLEEHKSVCVNPGLCYHDVAFILVATSNLMIYAVNVIGSLAKNEPLSSHLGTCANALLWKKTYMGTVKGTLKFPFGWYIYRESYLGQPWLTKRYCNSCGVQCVAVPGSSVLSTSACAGEQDTALPCEGCARQERSGREKKTCCLKCGAWG